MKINKSNYNDINKIDLHDSQIVNYNFCFETESLEIEVSLENNKKVNIKLYNVLGVKFSNACPWGGLAQDVSGCNIFLDIKYLIDKFDFPSREYMIIDNDIIHTSIDTKIISDYFQLTLFSRSGDELSALTDCVEVTEL